MDKKDIVEMRNQIEKRGENLFEIYVEVMEKILIHNEKKVDTFNEMLVELDMGIEFIPRVNLEVEIESGDRGEEENEDRQEEEEGESKNEEDNVEDKVDNNENDDSKDIEQSEKMEQPEQHFVTRGNNYREIV